LKVTASAFAPEVMKFVKNEAIYEAFQTIIRENAKKANVPPIAFDLLTWEVSTDRFLVQNCSSA
jgi:hypothetical protein